MEPLGQSQVFQYLRHLARGHDIHLLSFEKAADWADRDRRQALRRAAAEAGIAWSALRYHRSFSVVATAYDVAVGLFVALYIVLRHRCRIVHARSYVPSVIAVILQALLGVKFIFDMRGFWPDEKVDSGTWRAGSSVYRVAKWFERQFLLRADVVVSLTRAGVSAMRSFPYLQRRQPEFRVITTCTDLSAFRPRPPRTANRDEPAPPFRLGYVGTVRGWYLFEPVLDCFLELLAIRPDAELLIVNRGDHPLVEESLARSRVPRDRVVLESAEYGDIVPKLWRMDAGIFFIKPVFSKTASAPTKLGEFLACGIPCLTNAGAGDVASIVGDNGVGVLIDELTPASQRRAVRRLLDLAASPDVGERCRRTAESHFSLEDGVRAYDGLYQALAG
jgi:glycosyltransferase involved in cell wall biosynthesis